MEQTTPQIALNIVAWNSMAYLPAFFETLETQDLPLRVTVVDNASNDGSGAWVANNYPRVGMLRNMRNFGFSRAHNQAILLALSSWQNEDLSHCYILVSNIDVEYDRDCIRKMHEYMESHPEIDGCTPKLLRAHLQYIDIDNKETIRTNVLDSTGMSMSRALRAYDRGAGEEDKGQYDSSREVFGCTGACAMYRASSVQRASRDQQFYDEDLFAYKEDVDVSWRMRHLGMKFAYVPEAKAWHHRLAASQQKFNWFKALANRHSKPAFVNFLSTRNHWWVLTKNLTGREFWHCMLWLIPYEIAKFFGSLISWSALKGYWASLVGLPLAWRKRKALMKNMLPENGNLSVWFAKGK
ncbi:MAG: glycosyltransferase [Patescibacteria group bacterium]|nr:glycosyltransferase [Patescibacteria group bacterium]